MSRTKLSWVIGVFLGCAGCASFELYPDARRADRLFRDIVECARNEPENNFQKKCRKEFEDREFPVRVDSSKMMGVTHTTLFAEMGDPNQMINCSLRGARQRPRIESLHKGEVVKLKATPSRVSFGEVTFIHFEDCELVN